MSTREIPERCGTCRYWAARKPEEGRGIGTCHRFPPAVIPGYFERAMHPETSDVGWCGEWKLPKVTPPLHYLTEIGVAICGYPVPSVIKPALHQRFPRTAPVPVEDTTRVRKDAACVGCIIGLMDVGAL